jgi:hypothetical protein
VRRLLREAIPAYHPQYEFEDYLWTKIGYDTVPEFHEAAI